MGQSKVPETVNGNGKPCGIVRAIYPHGAVYEGQMNDKGQRHGWGRLLRPVSFVGWWDQNNLIGNAFPFDEDGKINMREAGWIKDNSKEYQEFPKDADFNQMEKIEAILNYKTDEETDKVLGKTKGLFRYSEKYNELLKEQLDKHMKE